MRFFPIKEKKKNKLCALMEQPLYSAQNVVELFHLSWRLVVAKHFGAKVSLFSLSFVFLCLSPSAQPWWLLLLMLSASFFLVVFSPNKTTTASARDIKHIPCSGAKHFSPGASPWLHKALMMWLYVESYELAADSSKVHIYSYAVEHLDQCPTKMCNV